MSAGPVFKISDAMLSAAMVASGGSVTTDQIRDIYQAMAEARYQEYHNRPQPYIQWDIVQTYPGGATRSFLKLPDGLSSDILEEATDKIIKWEDYDGAGADELAIELFVLFTDHR
jgi:hypothetical protein